ncbi:uncharacterized protein [Hetaerina americana]|uniref:uncharacterized protein n=1 Tax=Hetaerina americana TaxID=62018 RepID=UPI003A7F29C6
MAITEESFESYKEFHEHYMLNHNGTSLLESAVFISSPPTALLLWSVVVPAIRSSFANGFDSVGLFIVEFLVLVLPLVFTSTIFSDFTLLVSAASLMTWAILVKRNIGSNLRNKSSVSWLEILVPGTHRPFISLFRSYTNVITSLCILAVDFRVFPRKFAKTEVSGYGLMDTGTGLFVVAGALVSHKPSNAEGTITLARVIKSTSPFIVLGSIRYFCVLLLNYQTHVSEYGTHWNFFLTLAVIRVLGFVLTSVLGSRSSWRAGALFVFLAALHEWVLTSLGLREWVISDLSHRRSFVSANREGLVSLLGYLALHFAGEVIGRRTWDVPRGNARRWLHLWLELSSASLVAWGATHFLHGVTGVSRRVADLGYICWILAYSLTSLALFLGAELTISALRRCGSAGRVGDSPKTEEVVPVLLQAVNQNGLAYFLLGNLFTGIVNLSVRTLHVRTGPSVIILTLYMLILCAVANILYVKKIKLKVW